MEQQIHELERKIEEKESELHAIILDNEAAWAKEDLIREQSKEHQSYRRERDNSEAERVQLIKQVHDLHEHFQEKERQFMELQDQEAVYLKRQGELIREEEAAWLADIEQKMNCKIIEQLGFLIQKTIVISLWLHNLCFSCW